MFEIMNTEQTNEDKKPSCRMDSRPFCQKL